MDMLYARYSNPMELVGRYINQGRFGTFIRAFVGAEDERRQAEAEKNEEWMLWVAYIHSDADKSFNEWKRSLMAPGHAKAGKGADHDLTDEGAQAIVSRLFPQLTGPGK